MSQLHTHVYKLTPEMCPPQLSGLSQGWPEYIEGYRFHCYVPQYHIISAMLEEKINRVTNSPIATQISPIFMEVQCYDTKTYTIRLVTELVVLLAYGPFSGESFHKSTVCSYQNYNKHNTCEYCVYYQLSVYIVKSKRLV